MRKPVVLFLVPAAIWLTGCMQSSKVQTIPELNSLVGENLQAVEALLGKPGARDTSSVDGEIVLFFYEVMVRSEVDAKPRQRTVMVHLMNKVVQSVKIE